MLSKDLSKAKKGNAVIVFSTQEQEALKLFFQAEDGFVESQTLESQIWQGQVVTPNSLRKLISGLRLKVNEKESIKNIRGKGYQLNFQVSEGMNCQLGSPIFLISFTASFILVFASIFYLHFTDKQGTPELPKVSPQTVFQSNDNIIDYATYNEALYVTSRNKKESVVYEVRNRQKTKLMSADYNGTYRGIEIHKSGRTAMHVVEGGKCKIKIFERPVSELLDEIPCNRYNAYASFDWINKDKLYVTYNVELTAAIRPYVYDLKTKTLERVTTINFDSDNNQRFVDAFIKAHRDGMITMRENHLGEMSLVYFKGEERKELYNYRSISYSVGIENDNLYFISNNNELLKIELTEGLMQEEITPTVVLAPQASKIEDPLVLDGELYFSLGNTAKNVIRSVSGNFSYGLENGVKDFAYSEGVLSVLATTNTGYAVEQIKDGQVISSIYFDTDISLGHIAYFGGDIFVAGGAGIYKLVDKQPIQVSELKTIELVSTGQCMLAESKGIHKFDAESGAFTKLETQGNRPFASKLGCLYAGKLSGDIFNENREVVAQQTMMKLLIEYKGKIAHRYNEGENTVVRDTETDEVLVKTESRALGNKMEAFEDDILYLTKDEVNSSIVKLNFL